VGIDLLNKVVTKSTYSWCVIRIHDSKRLETGEYVIPTIDMGKAASLPTEDVRNLYPSLYSVINKEL
jgi:hypothetical protein